MYAKNERDFSISYNERRNDFYIHVGTWSNSNQSLADCLFYLELKTPSEEFFKEIEQYNELFINNKDNIIKDIERNKLNLLNSCSNEYNILDDIEDMSRNDRDEGILRSNEYYVVNFRAFELSVEESFKPTILEAIRESKNIKELYICLLDIKQDINEAFLNEWYSYSTVKEEL